MVRVDLLREKGARGSTVVFYACNVPSANNNNHNAWWFFSEHGDARVIGPCQLQEPHDDMLWLR